RTPPRGQCTVPSSLAGLPLELRAGADLWTEWTAVRAEAFDLVLGGDGMNAAGGRLTLLRGRECYGGGIASVWPGAPTESFGDKSASWRGLPGQEAGYYSACWCDWVDPTDGCVLWQPVGRLAVAGPTALLEPLPQFFDPGEPFLLRASGVNLSAADRLAVVPGGSCDAGGTSGAAKEAPQSATGG
ncbi:unnamed protein product, partial [Prorocentrum cordatum]